MRPFLQKYKFGNKNDHLSTWRDLKKCCVCMYKVRAVGRSENPGVPVMIWNFKPKISPIFHFEQVNEGWIIAILCVDKTRWLTRVNVPVLSEKIYSIWPSSSFNVVFRALARVPDSASYISLSQLMRKLRNKRMTSTLT